VDGTERRMGALASRLVGRGASGSIRPSGGVPAAFGAPGSVIGTADGRDAGLPVCGNALAGEGRASWRRSLARPLLRITAVAAISWFPALTAARTTAA
jgi:hypothetical protein